MRCRTVHVGSRKCESAGTSTIAPTMFRKNMKVSRMPMSAWNSIGEKAQVTPTVGAGWSGELGRRVECADLESGYSESLGLTTGPAAGIEDVGLRPEVREELLADRCHVHADRRAEELGRELVVVRVVVVRPWQRLARCRFAAAYQAARRMAAGRGDAGAAWQPNAGGQPILHSIRFAQSDLTPIQLTAAGRTVRPLGVWAADGL